jgi:ADP-heptose:LPS heptosyltransferase
MRLGKQLEIGLKELTAATLRQLLAQPPRNPQPPFERILFLRYGGIGDMILSLPVFRAAKARFPGVEIDVLCDRKNGGVLAGNRLVDHVYWYQKQPLEIAGLVAQLRSRRYDYLCNLVVYPSFTFGMLARLIGPGAIRAAGDQERYGYLYNRLVDLPPKREIHMLERLFLLAADVAGAHVTHTETPWISYDGDIRAKAAELERLVRSQLGIQSDSTPIGALNLSAGLERREWPREKYAELLRSAIARHRDRIAGWVIITDPRNPRDAEQFVQRFAGQPVVQLPPAEDFRVMMSFLPHVALLITPDTSFAHAASAMATPVLDLMIGENVTPWRPIGVPHEVVASDDPRNLAELPVEAVLGGLERLLRTLDRSLPADP